VVLDNAPFHTAAAVREREEDWEEMGLSLYRLPAYCPPLNLIARGCGEGSRVSSCRAASTTRWAS
jgi:transposase